MTALTALLVLNVEQGSKEWLDARAKRVTASRIADLLAKKIKSGEAAARANYRMEIVAAMASGEPQEDFFFTKDMAWGKENEKYARAAYQVETGCTVEEVGIVIHPREDRAAASPDGMVNWDGIHEPEGLLEIKCPKTKNHLSYIKSGGIPSEYVKQMHWQMAVTGAKWNDFVSFDPRLKGELEHLQLYICRLNRDEAQIKEIEQEVARFLDECDCEYKTLVNFGKEQDQDQEPESVA